MTDTARNEWREAAEAVLARADACMELVTVSALRRIPSAKRVDITMADGSTVSAVRTTSPFNWPAW